MSNIQLRCKTCGKEFLRHESEHKRNKTGNVYCSHECYLTTLNGDGNPNFDNHWTDELKKSQSEKIKRQYTTGRKPWDKGLTKEIDPRLAKCGVIGNDFGKYSKGSKRPDNIWRNVLNSAGIRYGLQQEHKYKYHGENWLRIRKDVLQRDNYTCQKCGSKEELVAPHDTI